jgi:hypothetical protein
MRGNQKAHRRNRGWGREDAGQHDEAWFKCEIAPKLDMFSLKEIAKASSCEGSASAALGGLAQARGFVRARSLGIARAFAELS